MGLTEPHAESRPRTWHCLKRLSCALAICALGYVWGCGGDANPNTPTNSGNSTEKSTPKLTLIDAASAAWTQDQALGYLDDKDRAVSAAVRLVQLADAHPLCVPETLTDDLVSQLRVIPLGEAGWALGVAERGAPRTLRAPVLIDATGAVTVVADGAEEEALVLSVSKDAEVYPHLLISPLRVWVANTIPPELALSLDAPPPIGFRAREEGGHPYIGLVRHGKSGWEEIARYIWQPYELLFAGPASDALPDPPGGKFQLDMEQSPLLIPQGGEILPPKPNRVPETPVFGPDWDA